MVNVWVFYHKWGGDIGRLPALVASTNRADLERFVELFEPEYGIVARIEDGTTCVFQGAAIASDF